MATPRVGEQKGETEKAVEAGALGAKGSMKFTTLAQDSALAELERTAEAGPTLLMIDEAQSLTPDFGQEILVAAQRCFRRKLPLLLVLAGTPGVIGTLMELEASFAERSHEIAIGRLASDDDVSKALAVPAEQSGTPLDGDALELLVRECQRYPNTVQFVPLTLQTSLSIRRKHRTTQGPEAPRLSILDSIERYPYFVQTMGSETWDQGQSRDPRQPKLTLSDAQAAVEGSVPSAAPAPGQG